MKPLRLLKIYSIVRSFVFSTVNKEFLIFLFFLGLSGGFWLLATLNETYEKDFIVPIHLTNLPKDVVITSNDDDVVRVTLRDKGFTIMGYLYTERLRPIVLNFANYANKSRGKGVIPAADIQKQLYTHLSGSTKIVAVKPDKLEFFFNYGESKRVPVRLLGNIQPGDQRYLANYKFIPEYVTVYAHNKELRNIKEVQTEELNIVNFSDTIVQTVALHRIEGVKIVPSTVRLALYPDVLTEESVEVPVSAENLPGDKVLRTFPSKVKVHFIVGVSRVRSIKADAFKVVVNYADLVNQPADKCTLYLRKVPQGVRKARLEINQVDYLIEQK